MERGVLFKKVSFPLDCLDAVMNTRAEIYVAMGPSVLLISTLNVFFICLTSKLVELAFYDRVVRLFHVTKLSFMMEPLWKL